ADYAVWQREQLAGEGLDRQLAYWREQLAGAPELLELPTDHSRPAVQTYRGATVPVELSPELLERLQALGRSEGATLFMTLLGAFQVLLSKYGGGDDVVVGSDNAGRTRREVEGLIGFFINTLVLRTDLGGDPSFREVLGRVREVTLGAYNNQEVPFERVVAALQPERSLSHSPLFQVMFTLQNAGGGGGAFPGLKVEGLGAAMDNAKFDLSLTLLETAQGLRGTLEYSTDLFERGTAERMAGHLARVLEQVADDADVRLSRLALAGPEERARVVVEWNRTGRPFPREACIHQLFQAQAGRTPGAVALVWGGEELTYRELDARANRLAHHLAGLGVGPESRVGVRVERSVENVVATLAVLKTGGCCVPVDTSYPAERMALMLADSAVRVLLSDGEIAAGQDIHVLRLDQVEVLAAGRDHPLSANVSAENLAYVFYTSGSTGRPKGVMMAHREVVQYAACLPETMPLGPGDRVAQASNASFDAAVFEIWGALFHGATLVGIDRDVLLSAPLLGQALREQEITHLYQTAALFNQHVREQVDVYASLRQLVFGAEAVGTEGVRQMLRSGKPARVLHEYGPTEATVWCTLEEVEEVAEDAPTVSIGHPIPNARAYVLDAAGEPLPVGVPGDLCIGGDGVVRGYLGRPGLTAERFVPDPFAAEPGGRMYRTGDRARWTADGKLEFLGRLDDQVKIRGFRIEPGEVEAAIAGYPGVREARVMMREDQPGDKRLVAYVVGDVEVEVLRAHLRESLPEYMVPRAIVTLDRLPLNANGKVDRKALPVPEYAAGTDRYVAPRTPVEEVLAGIWAEVLRLERAGVEESFFDLGGHSLLAIRVMSRVREVLGVELPLRALCAGPTVAELAGRVEEMRRTELPVLPPVVPVERNGALPLSFAQERLWFINRLEPESAAYNVPMAWRVDGALDQAALERSLSEIVRRHEALRTLFPEVDGSPAQVIAPFGGFILPVEDLSRLSDPDREAAVRRRADEEAARPFDLSAAPLFRAVLLRLDAEDHVLLLGTHHILVDQWSLGVLRRELSTLYAAYREDGESPLSALPVQYADYAVWQREQLRGEVLDRHLAYWTERLAGAPELLELPTDRPRPAVQTYRGALEGITLSGELLARLEALGRGEGATPFMTLLAAFQVLLSKYAGSEDVVVGSPISGRTRREVEELIGLFLNTLVLRTDLSGDPGFREVLRRVREMTLGAFEHQEIPFERLVT
ncbi:MAG TPA: amino acid adenylation domain-containing protein, partial [Longimicrobium sp.]|nr:amino acid adenylation domain-containing protein [Longimicrobium sp.]